jgi:magnesium-transporting ATPase (P-type)
MITGDKGDTAQQVGFASGMFERLDSKIYKLDEYETSPHKRLDEIATVGISTSKFGFMIAGS